MSSQDLSGALTPPSPVPHWERLKSPAFDRALAERTTVILPIGSTEQHGPHLPVAVDSALVTEVARRAAAGSTPERPVLVLPTLWVSLAEHHMNDGGSLTLDYDTLRAFIRCVASSLKRQGYRHVLLLNGHGGNMAALNTIVDTLSVELELPLATATYWVLAARAFGEILEAQGTLLHACEAETSMMMHLHPELVDVAAARSVDAPPRGFLQPNGFHRWHGMAYWSRCGVVGVPAQASADKGRRLLEAAGSTLATLLANGAPWNDVPGSGAPAD